MIAARDEQIAALERGDPLLRRALEDRAAELASACVASRHRRMRSRQTVSNVRSHPWPSSNPTRTTPDAGRCIPQPRTTPRGCFSHPGSISQGSRRDMPPQPGMFALPYASTHKSRQNVISHDQPTMISESSSIYHPLVASTSKLHGTDLPVPSS